MSKEHKAPTPETGFWPTPFDFDSYIKFRKDCLELEEGMVRTINAQLGAAAGADPDDWAHGEAPKPPDPVRFFYGGSKWSEL